MPKVNVTPADCTFQNRVRDYLNWLYFTSWDSDTEEAFKIFNIRVKKKDLILVFLQFLPPQSSSWLTAQLNFVVQWSLYTVYVPHSGHYMYRQFNITQFYVLPTQCIYVFCVDLRTNRDYFPIQH